MEDLLKCQISHVVKYHRTKQNKQTLGN